MSSAPGSMHDMKVLKKSDLWGYLEGGWRPFIGAMGLGDSAYTVNTTVQGHQGKV